MRTISAPASRTPVRGQRKHDWWRGTRAPDRQIWTAHAATPTRSHYA